MARASTPATSCARIKVVGRDGVELHERWNGDARAYLGMTVPGFPNFFIIYGPNTNIVVNGSIIFFSRMRGALHRGRAEAAGRDRTRDDGGEAAASTTRSTRKSMRPTN